MQHMIGPEKYSESEEMGLVRGREPVNDYNDDLILPPIQQRRGLVRAVDPELELKSEDRFETKSL